MKVTRAPGKPLVLLNGIKLHQGPHRAPTGNFQHVLHLAAALAQVTDIDLRVLTDVDSHPALAERIEARHLVRTRFSGGSVVSADREVVRAVRNLRPDVYHRPTGQLPFQLPKVAAVATIADLNFTVLPTPWIKRLYKFLSYRWTVQRADWITCVSEFTRKDVIHRLKARPDRTTVIHHGAIALPEPRWDLADQAGPTYWLTFGHETHKNVETCLEVLSILPRVVRLVVIGATEHVERVLKPMAREMEVTDRVIFPGMVSAAHLSGLYRRATGLLFLSRYEGFGLPVLEAMEVGCPVICSDCCSLPEVAGDGAVVLPPDGGSALVSAMQKIQHEANFRVDLIERGKRRAATFSWAKAAAETADIYKRLCGLTANPV